jgi:hypothetical protein
MMQAISTYGFAFTFLMSADEYMPGKINVPPTVGARRISATPRLEHSRPGYGSRHSTDRTALENVLLHPQLRMGLFIVKGFACSGRPHPKLYDVASPPRKRTKTWPHSPVAVASRCVAAPRPESLREPSRRLRGFDVVIGRDSGSRMPVAGSNPRFLAAFRPLLENPLPPAGSPMGFRGHRRQR